MLAQRMAKAKTSTGDEPPASTSGEEWQQEEPLRATPDMPPLSTTPPREGSPARVSTDEPTRVEEELLLDLPLADQMDVDATIEETAKDAAAKVAADEAAKDVHEEAAKGSAGEVGKETGCRTGGIPAVGHDLFVSIPRTASTGAPTEGEVFDEEVIAAAGLKVVDELSASSSGSMEDQLLQAMSSNFQKLQALHRAHKEKLDSRAAVVDVAEADFQKRIKQMQVWFAEARQELRTSQEQPSHRWDKLLLKQFDVEKAQEEAAAQAAKDDAQLRERRVLLDAQEEDLAAREEALAAKLRSKDEEFEKLLKEAVDAAKAAEAAKNELAEKVEKLEADLEKLASSANDSIANLKLKLTTLEESLEGSRAREKTLAKDLQEEKQLLESTAGTYNDYVKDMGIWTERLIDVAEMLTTQLSIMGMQSFRFSHEERVTPSARLTMFFEAVLDALMLLHSSRATQLANEFRKLCRGVLLKVLTKVAYRNLGPNPTNVLDSLPEDADRKAFEELVVPIVDLVDQVKRVEG
nr:plectin-like [Aegilops tauschii subsp. strangulata]